MQEVRQAFRLQSHRTDAHTVTQSGALRWATRGATRCMGRSADLGAVEAGKPANLALLKRDEPRFFGTAVGLPLWFSAARIEPIG